jgi:hypothetical protein
VNEPQKLGPEWPPAWNPFEVFLLVLSIVSSAGLVRGHSGSAVLDERLPVWEVGAWGLMLASGSLIALAGIYCYRSRRRLMLGLYLERTGLILVGGAAAIYSYVVFLSAADVDGVRWAVTVQTAYSAACFFRAWQDHRAIRWTHRHTTEVEAV